MKTSPSPQSGFLRDESAQAMVVGALSMLFILPTVALVYNVSALVNRRIQVQQAADAAAYSGALVEANSLSSLAVVNESMAYTYYGLMRQVVDVIVTGVLAEFEERGFPPEVVGIQNATQRYDEAYALASEWVPRGERWLDRLGRMSQAIAISTPRLMLEEAAKAAHTNGAVAASVFPVPVFIPDRGFRRLYYIEKLANGWRITDDFGYLLEIRLISDQKWEITESGGDTIVFEQLAAEHWKVTIGHYEVDLHTDGESYMRMDITDDNGVNTHAEARKVFGNSWEFSVNSPGFSLHLLPFQDGTYQVDVSGPEGSYSERVRWDDANRIMVLSNGQWEYLPDQEGSVDVGGVTVDVDYVRELTFPGGQFYPPNFIGLHNLAFSAPNYMMLREVDLRFAPGLVTLFGHHEPVRYRIDTAASFDINRLTLNDADGLWRYLNERDRHRIIPNSDVFWTYEWVRDPTPLLEESPLRLGYHAVMDNDPQARTQNGFEWPEWTRWFRVDAGEAASPQAYYQTRPSGGGQLRVYQYQTGDRNEADYHQVKLFDAPPPLKISESFWNFGFNVAVWAPGPRPLLGQQGPQRTLFPFFRQSPTGLFAVASARVGFLFKSQGPSGSVEQKVLFNFPTLADAKQWSQTGFQCLYEPVWMAKLVPVVEGIWSDGIDMAPVDSGVGFLFRVFRDKWWMEVGNPEDFSLQRARQRPDVRAAFRNLRNRAGSRLNTDDPAFAEILEH